MVFTLLTYNAELAEFISYNDFDNYQLLSLEANLSCFIYYFDFKLLICSTCNFAINPIYLKGHIFKHLSSYKGELKTSKATTLYSLFNTLEINTLSNSLDLIIKFQENINRFFKFKELIISPFYKCLVCNIILKSKQNLLRHYSLEHNNSNINPFYIVIKGQSLETHRYFFEIYLKEKNKEINISRESSLEINKSINNLEDISNSNSLDIAKNEFLAKFNLKEQGFLNKLNSFRLDYREKLTPFQIKTRYIEYINKYNIKDLVDLVLPISKEEKLLEILIINLKEILYLSLEKIIYLNKIHLFILNSFEKNKVKNKTFKPLLNNNTRIKYFKFFSLFLVYFFRGLEKSLDNNISYFKVNKTIVSLYKKLKDLITLKLEEDNYLETSSKAFKKNKKNISNNLSKFKINNILNNKSLDIEEDTSSISSLESSFLTISSLDTSSSSSKNSSSSNNSNNSIDFTLLDSSNKEVLEKIQSINNSQDLISIKIKKYLIELIIEIFQEKQDLYLFSSSINCFFATISIRAKDNSFKDSLELSQNYSQFIYSAQLVVIEFCFSKLFANTSLILTEILSEFMDNYFNNSASTALAEILNNRAYCFKINKEISTSNFISISNTSKETISYNKITISVDNLRDLFKELISISNSLLEDKLLFNISKSRYKDINLKDFSLLEDRNLTTPFKCFRDLSPNSTKNNNFLKEEIFSNSSLFKRFFIKNSSNNLELNYQEIKGYLKDLLQFKKYCLLLVYLTTGLPLRGTELVTLKYLNSYKDKRDIFLDISSNLFIVNISYYKGQGLSEKKASNIRYLSTSVSQIFLLYIVLIDPFIQFLNINILSTRELNKTKSLVPYFFFTNNSLLDSRDLSYSLSSFSNKILGQKLNIQAYRQIIISIIKEFMLENLNSNTLLLEEKSSEFSELVAMQSNHSLKVEDFNYARSSLVFSNISSNFQFKYLQFCLRFFAFFKINLIDFSLDSYQSELRIKNNLEKNNNLNIANSFAIKFIKVDNNLNYSKKHSRQISSISTSLTPISKRVKTKELINLSSLELSSNILSNLLKDFLGDISASFRSLEQELLIKSIILKVPYILAILPTSIGKSLSYLLTSSLSISKVTIIIIPLVGLKNDILRRASEFNIPCNIYENNREFKNLTLVSIETITSNYFISQVKELINSNNIDRIIIEECHLLISASSYRSIMFQFKELLLLPLQFVFLTGTLPLLLEEKIISNLFLKDISIIRASCLRNNISYKTSIYKSFKEEDKILEIQEYIEDFKVNNFLTIKDKIIIFCSSIKNIELVATILNCNKYHSNLSKEEKENNLNNFFNNSSEFYKIIVSSTALEEGLDYSFIRLVIYKDIAYSFIGFLQGSSRGGRDNLGSTSIFFHSSHHYQLSNCNNIEDKLYINKYLEEKICRKRPISLYLDNKVINSCDLNTSLCDLCFARLNITTNQVNRVLESNKEVEKNSLRVKELLVTAFNTCIFCLLLHLFEEVPISQPHLVCPFYKDIDLLALVIKARVKKREFYLSANSCCFNCLLPTIICSYFKKSSTSACFNLDFMPKVLALFYIKRDILGFNKQFDLAPFLSLDSFLKIFLRKEFLIELDTEGLLAFQVLISE